MSEGVRDRPPRPALPLALWALAGAWLCDTAVMGCSFSATPRSCLLGVLVSLLGSVGLGVASAYLSRRRHSGTGLRISVLALACCLALLGAFAACARQHVAVAHMQASAVSRWQIKVVSDARESSYGYRCLARVEGRGIPRVRVWLTSKERLGRGGRLTCVGRFSPLSDDDFGRSNWAQGVCGTVLVVRVLSSQDAGGIEGLVLGLRRAMLGRIDPSEGEGRALVAGCVCANREALEGLGLSDAFATCGIAHLIAVSGAHLGVVAAVMSQLLAALELSPHARTVILALTTGTFVLCCGAPLSALRAWVMSLVAFGAQTVGRRSHALSSVSVVALAMALMDPTLVSQMAFVLSVGSVVGLCLLNAHASYVLGVIAPCPRLPRLVRSSARRRFQKAYDAARDTLAATLVCQLVTLPVVAAVFGRLSLVAPLASLLAGPLMSVLMTLGLLVCLAIPLPLACDALLGACDLLAQPLCVGVRSLARLPFASVSTVAIAAPMGLAVPLLLAGWLAWWPKVERRELLRLCAAMLAIMALLLGRWRYLMPARVVILDIGQGDAILVQDGASAVLVDTGPDAAVVDALARNHVLHLDAVVLTHLHDDHYGGLDDLAGCVACERVVVAQGVVDAMPQELMDACHELTGQNPIEIAYGDTLRAGGFGLRMVWPHDEVDGDENGESIELAVSYGRGQATLSALLTGDAEQDELDQILSAGDLADIDLLKVGHHGSKVSLTYEQACALAPELAVASAGEGNDYGHPSSECVEVLQRAGAVFLCTKDVGDVDVRPGSSGLRVIAQSRRLDDLS